MTAITISVNVSGTPDTADRQGMLFAIATENELRAIKGIALLPFATGSERKTSYETILAAQEVAAHLERIEQAALQADQDAAFKTLKPLWIEATPAKKAAALAALQ